MEMKWGSQPITVTNLYSSHISLHSCTALPETMWVLFLPPHSSWVTEKENTWELDCKEGWAPKNWCFQIVVLEKSLENPLDSNEIKPVNPKGNQPWIFSGRINGKAEVPILWPPDVKSQFFGKDSDAGKDWGQEEKGETEDEMVR